MRYDNNLAVIGAGSAGLISALIAGTARAKVTLIERDAMGGDCLNTGCVPSKTLIASANLAAAARRAGAYGVHAESVSVDFPAVMARVHDAIATIAPKDSVERYGTLGVDCVLGDAEVVSPHEIRVGDERVTARRIVVASGAGPLVPPIPGLDQTDYLTSENIWSLEALPERLVVLGAGPIGCELAQAFARLGSDVTLVDMAERVLPREDPDASEWVAQSLREDGVDIRLSAAVTSVGSGAVETAAGSIPVDQLLVALGRRARTSGFGLAESGVELNRDGTIQVDKHMRTSVRSIFAAGDVVGPYQFTHMASHQAWYASVNALADPFWRFALNESVVPWTTFTDPELARVGLSAEEAEAQGIEHGVTLYPLDDLDRAIAEGRTEGFIKLVTKGDQVLGATIVGAHAGEMIQAFVSAMTTGMSLKDLLGVIHPYPGFMEATKLAAGQWRRENAPERLLNLARVLNRWTRRLP